MEINRSERVVILKSFIEERFSSGEDERIIGLDLGLVVDARHMSHSDDSEIGSGEYINATDAIFKDPSYAESTALLEDIEDSITNDQIVELINEFDKEAGVKTKKKGKKKASKKGKKNGKQKK